jgi:hypothetical protein
LTAAETRTNALYVSHQTAARLVERLSLSKHDCDVSVQLLQTQVERLNLAFPNFLTHGVSRQQGEMVAPRHQRLNKIN